MKHKLLPDKDVAELRKVAQSGIAFLPIETESITPLELVEMTFAKLLEWQTLPDRPANELINALGFAYGYCIQLDCSWKWHLIQHDDDTFDYAIVHPEQKFYIFPRGMVWDHFNGLKHNLVLQFRMISEGRLPECNENWQELA
jgi:hypothetical protein